MPECTGRNTACHQPGQTPEYLPVTKEHIADHLGKTHRGSGAPSGAYIDGYNVTVIVVTVIIVTVVVIVTLRTYCVHCHGYSSLH